MCIAPVTLGDGTVVACRECWQCRERAINDWVGRNIAESKTSVASHAVTLTYGRNSANDVDHERAVILTYSDVQKYLKLLRRHGYPVRYFVTGEFGSLKGRAHWHVILHWQDKVPPHVLDKRFNEEHWPHGWSHWTEPNAAQIRYNCKYIQKDMGDAAQQGHLAMSKKPPLGMRYFEDLARQYVRQGLSPQSLEYGWPDVLRRRSNRDARQEPIRFRLKDRPAELFLEFFIAEWTRVHGTRWPVSELVDLFAEYGRVVVDENKVEQKLHGDPDLRYRTPLWMFLENPVEDEQRRLRVDYNERKEQRSEDGEARQRQWEREQYQRDVEREWFDGGRSQRAFARSRKWAQ